MLDLPGCCAWQPSHKFHGARIFVGSNLGLHILLKHAPGSIVGLGTVAQHHKGLGDLATFMVRNTDYGALQHVRVAEQGRLDLRPGNLIAGTDNQVIGAGHVPEISLLVHAIGIAGNVPSVLHIFLLLLRSIEIAAAGRTTHGKPSDGVRGRRIALVVDYHCLISRDRLAGCSRTNVFSFGGNKDVQHLG